MAPLDFFSFNFPDLELFADRLNQHKSKKWDLLEPKMDVKSGAPSHAPAQQRAVLDLSIESSQVLSVKPIQFRLPKNSG